MAPNSTSGVSLPSRRRGPVGGFVEECLSVKAWRVREFGEPENVLALEEAPVPVAGPGELLVRVAAATLNVNDVDGVRGRYRTVRPTLPYTPGMEVLGRVEAA